MDLLDDTALVCSLAGLTKQQTKALEQAGWNMMRLATLAGCSQETLEAVRWNIQEKNESFDISIADLKEVARRSQTRAETRHKIDAIRGGQELLDAYIAH